MIVYTQFVIQICLKTWENTRTHLLLLALEDYRVECRDHLDYIFAPTFLECVIGLWNFNEIDVCFH